MKNKDMSLVGVVRTLVGPVNPVGETNADNVRYENLEVLMQLVDLLLEDIGDVRVYAGRPEASLARAGNHANAFFTNLKFEMGEE